jgi:hypothetical protein
MRDLVVHGDDLVVATHGRGFWILDNITPLRELARMQRESSISGPLLFKPQTAYRLRRNNNTDTPLPPEAPAGRNPADGADLDYFLPADVTGPVTLEILTADGALVRRYSSEEHPERLNELDYNVPMYWARQPPALSSARGMHRFVWDLRYPPPRAVERDFPISAIAHDTPLEPLGLIALPGSYLVRLTVNGAVHTAPLTLRTDPRARITPLGLSRQFSLARRIVRMMDRSYTEYRTALASQQPERAATLRALNLDLAAAYEVVEGADRAPTAQAVRATATLERRLAGLSR